MLVIVNTTTHLWPTQPAQTTLQSSIYRRRLHHQLPLTYFKKLKELIIYKSSVQRYLVVLKYFYLFVYCYPVSSQVCGPAGAF